MPKFENNSSHIIIYNYLNNRMADLSNKLKQSLKDQSINLKFIEVQLYDIIVTEFKSASIIDKR